VVSKTVHTIYYVFS